MNTAMPSARGATVFTQTDPWPSCLAGDRGGSTAQPTDAFAREWGARLDDLLDIRRMEDDWDGLGAPAPSLALVDRSLRLALILKADNVQPPCRVVAGLTGTVLFEWQHEGGVYFELEVVQPQYAEWTQIAPDQPTETGGITW